jgi:hypothetical protein
MVARNRKVRKDHFTPWIRFIADPLIALSLLFCCTVTGAALYLTTCLSEPLFNITVRNNSLGVHLENNLYSCNVPCVFDHFVLSANNGNGISTNFGGSSCLTMSHGIVVDNFDTGAYIYSVSVANFSDVEFRSNQGAGLAVIYHNSVLQVDNCTFSNNRDYGLRVLGAGTYAVASITNSSFRSNPSRGLSIECGSSRMTVLVQSNLFEYNGGLTLFLESAATTYNGQVGEIPMIVTFFFCKFSSIIPLTT